MTPEASISAKAALAADNFSSERGRTLQWIGAVLAVVDSGFGRRVVKGLQACDVGELFLKQALDPVDGVLPLGAEDVEVAGDGEVLVLVADGAAPLEIHH